MRPRPIFTVLLLIAGIYLPVRAGDSLAFDSLSRVLKEPFSSREHIDRLNEMVQQLLTGGRTSDELIAQQSQALSLARQAGYKKGEADALSNLVRLYLEWYESSISLEYALEAIKLYEELGDEENLCYNLMQLGIIYYTSQNFEKSQQYYDQAIERFTKTGNHDKISTIHYLSGLNYSKMGRHPQALSQFRQAIAFLEPEDHKSLAECLTGIAELFIRQEEPDSALHYAGLASTFLDGLKLDGGLPDTITRVYGQAKISIIRSSAFFMKKDKVRCSRHAAMALEAAQKANYRELILEALNAMSRALALNGDYPGAYEMIHSYMTLRDSLFNEKNAARIAQLESAYLLEKNEKQIAILEREKKISRILLTCIAAVAVLVLALALVLYNRFQIKKKANQQLVEAYEKLKDTQEQLLHHKKMASLGRLATGISHEIQNPLNFVNNFSEVSIELLHELRETPLTGQQRELVNDLLNDTEKTHFHGKRAQHIIKRLQDHSNVLPGMSEPVDINSLVLQCLERAYDTMKSENGGDFNCKVIRQLDLSLNPVRVQATQIIRVLYNIIFNALQAVNEKAKMVPENFIPELMIESLDSGGKVRITCTDNGTGMDDFTLERAFEPFFTTKPTGSSTGLGLSISYDIVKAHRGEITLQSERGKYTAVTILLPYG